MMDKLTITLIRRGNETEDMNIAVNVLVDEDKFRSGRDGQAGLLRDDDGVVAYWEWDVT